MKRYLSIAFASVLGLCGAMSGDQKAQPVVEQSIEQNTLPAGLHFVKETREAFYSGEYKTFLENAEKTYKKNMKSHTYDSFLEARRDTLKMSASMKEAENNAPSSEYEKKSDALLSKRDQKLSDLIVSHDSELLAQSLKNSVFFDFSDDQKSSLQMYFDLHNKFKGDGTSPLENELIAIDTEFWLKQRDLDMAHIKGKHTNEEYAKYALVLEFAKLDAMKNAALKEPSTKLAHAILVTHAVYPTQAAIVHDQKMLVKLGEGKLSSNSPFEKKLQGIMKQYVQDRTELTAKYFP